MMTSIYQKFVERREYRKREELRYESAKKIKNRFL